MNTLYLKIAQFTQGLPALLRACPVSAAGATDQPGTWPAICQICAAWPSAVVCSACLERFGSEQSRCLGCAQVLLAPSGSGHCGACLRRASPLKVCAAALDYRYPWDRLVSDFKFQQQPAWAQTFAALLWRRPTVRACWQRADLALPIALGPKRLAERGYNQAWELLKALQSHSPAGPRCLPDGLLRPVDNGIQHRLKRAERWRNMAGAFATNPHHLALIQGASVLLVDDVRTTGATLEAAARCLLRSGAARVDAVVLAQARH